MFNNLIESTSHAREFKRRGSFVLFTSATYVLLFVVAGVMSIYAYDARLDDQNTEIITMLNPLELAAPKPATPATHPPPRGNTNKLNEVIRENNFVSINHPEKVPETASAKPNPGLPVPDHGDYTVGDHDSDPGVSGGIGIPGSAGTESAGGGTPTVELGTPPPVMPPVHPPVPKVVSKGVITGLAVELPKPLYPPIAKQMRVQGTVNVQVLVDEHGKVISARAILGNPVLMAAAQQAAYGARFTPTRLGEQAVKVSGVITYNFVLQ